MRLRKGQMIMEVIVAFTVTVIALVALLQLTRRSVGSAGGSGRTSAATAYANAGMEWVTNEKIINGGSWEWLRKKCLPDEPANICGPTVYCLGILSWSSPSCDISNTEFSRNVRFEIQNDAAQRILEVKVVVSWVEGGFGYTEI